MGFVDLAAAAAPSPMHAAVVQTADGTWHVSSSSYSSACTLHAGVRIGII